MPQSNRPSPFYCTNDRKTVRLYQGDCRTILRRLPPSSVHTVIVSPPYWGLRDYGTDKSMEIGSEPTPDEYVDSIVEVFRWVRRVLRDDGTLWLNLGDTYSNTSCGGESVFAKGRTDGRSGDGAIDRSRAARIISKPQSNLKFRIAHR